MNSSTHDTTGPLGTLAADARDLMANTVEEVGRRAGNVGRHFTSALEQGKEIYGQARDGAIGGVLSADRFVRRHPYQDILVSVGIGVVLGYWISRHFRQCEG